MNDHESKRSEHEKDVNALTDRDILIMLRGDVRDLQQDMATMCSWKDKIETSNNSIIKRVAYLEDWKKKIVGAWIFGIWITAAATFLLVLIGRFHDFHWFGL
jgi:hypothetical protein